MAARLKVYRSHIVFYETVVAAPSQKAALEAWDVRQNLFAEGAAEVTDDPDTVKAALAQPGVVLKRAAGSNDVYAADPSTPSLPAGKKAKTVKPNPDRRALEDAEAALETVNEMQSQQKAEFDARRRALEHELHTTEARWRAERKAAERVLEQARSDYEKASRNG